MKRKRRQAKEPVQQYHYHLSRDEDRIIIEAVALGALVALRDYPEHKMRAQLDTEARAALVKSKVQKGLTLTNDFAALCALYIPHFTYGYENMHSCYERDQVRYQENKALLAENGWAMMLLGQQRVCAGKLAAMKEDMKTFQLKPE